jgi:HSP20 family protein
MTAMTSWDLFEDLRTAQDEVRRLSGRGSRRPGRQRDGDVGSGAWAPAVDIAEGKDAYLVSAEIPGVSADNIQVTLEDGLLTIQGERLRGDKEASAEQVHRSEQRYGLFRRSITLPSQVEAGRIEASAQDGVLLILVPKPKETRAERISVRSGERHKPLTPGEASRNGR